MLNEDNIKTSMSVKKYYLILIARFKLIPKRSQYFEILIKFY